MTFRLFHRRHGYRLLSAEGPALVAARKVNREAEGFSVHVVKFGAAGYGLVKDTHLAELLDAGVVVALDVRLDYDAPVPERLTTAMRLV